MLSFIEKVVIIMCVAAPGRVIQLSGTKAIVDFNGNRLQAEAGLVNVKVGDFVLVHAGCILQVLSAQEKESLFSLLEELENA